MERHSRQPLTSSSYTELRSIEGRISEARRADLADLAVAIRSGQTDAGDRRVLAAEGRKNELARRRAGILLALESAQRDVASLLGRQRAHWSADLDAALVADRAAARSTFGRLREQLEGLGARQAARRWVDQPGTGKNLAGGLGRTTLTSNHGDSNHTVLADNQSRPDIGERAVRLALVSGREAGDVRASGAAQDQLSTNRVMRCLRTWLGACGTVADRLDDDRSIEHAGEKGIRVETTGRRHHIDAQLPWNQSVGRLGYAGRRRQQG